jgi:hypothetical protein
LPVAPKPYPLLHFFAANGKAVAYLTAGFIAAAALALFFAGYGAVWLVAGGILAVCALVMLICFAELIDLIVDTMIPK